MSSTECPRCGYLPAGSDEHEHVAIHASSRRSDEPSPDLGAAATSLPIVPDIGAGAAAQNHTSGSDETGARRAIGRRTTVVIGAILCVLAALVAASLIGGADDGSSGSGDDAALADGSSTGDAASATSAPSSADIASDAAEADIIDAGADDAGFDSVAGLFESWVDGERSWTVVYPSPMGLQVLNADGTSQPDLEVAVGFQEAAQLPLISDGRRTWAIDPNDPATAYVVSTQFLVTDVDRDGRVAFVNDRRDPSNIGESSFGAWGPGFDLPPDAEVIAVAGRGLFVLPVTGGTYEYVANGVEPFSDDRLVAASVDSEVFERCDERLACELYVTRPQGDDPVVLDTPVDATVWISPEGRWVVAAEPSGASTLTDLESGRVHVIEGRVRAVDWSDDGTLAALITDDELVVFRPATAEMRGVTLPVAPSASSVLLVNA